MLKEKLKLDQLSLIQKLIIGALIIVLFFVLYRFGVVRTTEQRISEANTTLETMDTQVIGLEAKTNQMHAMQASIESERDANGTLNTVSPKYDNFEYVMNQLNALLSGVENYSINFQPVASENDLIRRGITISFTAGTYNGAKTIMNSLQNGMYRCKIDTLSISGSDGSINSGAVTVNLSLTFYEWM